MRRSRPWYQGFPRYFDLPRGEPGARGASGRAEARGVAGWVVRPRMERARVSETRSLTGADADVDADHRGKPRRRPHRNGVERGCPAGDVREAVGVSAGEEAGA